MVDVTTDEIKAAKSMQEVLLRYGLQPNRGGFIPCPFHQGDREASCKIYDTSFYCFGCGVAGDIFTFVQKMDHVSFKEAFQLLGGSYEVSFSAKFRVERARKERQKREKEIQERKLEQQLNQKLITIYRTYLGKYEPLSAEWAECYNALQYQIYLQEYLQEKR